MNRNRIPRIAFVLALSAVGILSAVGSGTAAPADKIWICHGTASETNPYVLIHVSGNALAGHLDGTGPGHGQKSHIDFVDRDGDGDCGTALGGGDTGGGIE